MERRWRVAVMGLGHWYSAYGLARALREYRKAELVAAAWHDRDQLEAFTRAFGVRGYTDHAELLRREEVDIVHVAPPVVEIPEVAVLCARAGKHIVLGKPMAMTVEEADRVVEAIASAGVFCVPFQAVARLRQRELKTRVEAGEIGDLLVIHQTSRWSIAEDWYMSGKPGWFADPRRVPGGAFVDEGIYGIDFVRWITGSEIVRVEARMASLVHRELEVEDWGMATFTLEDGVVATLEAGWTITAPRATGPSPKENSVVRLELVGSRGEIHDQRFRSPGRAVLRAGAEDWVYERRTEPTFAPPTPSPLAHLIESLEAGRPPIADVEDARRSFVVAMAAYEAAREGRPVELSWSDGRDAGGRETGPRGLGDATSAEDPATG
jgi:predicted dehydrogenase